VAVTAAMLALAVVGACSSDKQPNHPSQASVTINGTTVASKQRVTCVQQQWRWTINIGDQNVAGAKALVSNTDGNMVADSVHIRNLGGFTGMYAAHDGGSANVSFSSETFTITGKAQGYSSYKSGEPAEATFKIVATC
jgi:hypothetical protein